MRTTEFKLGRYSLISALALMAWTARAVPEIIGPGATMANPEFNYRPQSTPTCPFNAVQINSEVMMANDFLSSQLVALAKSCPKRTESFKQLADSVKKMADKTTGCSRLALDSEYRQAIGEASSDGIITAENFSYCKGQLDKQNCVNGLYQNYIRKTSASCARASNTNGHIQSGQILQDLVTTLAGAADDCKNETGAVLTATNSVISSFFSNVSSPGVGMAISAIGGLMNKIIENLAPSDSKRAADALIALNNQEMLNGLLCVNLAYAKFKCDLQDPRKLYYIDRTFLTLKKPKGQSYSSEEIRIDFIEQAVIGLEALAEKNSSQWDCAQEPILKCDQDAMRASSSLEFCEAFEKINVFDIPEEINTPGMAVIPFKTYLESLTKKNDNQHQMEISKVKDLLDYCNPALPKSTVSPKKLKVFLKVNQDGVNALERVMFPDNKSDSYQALIQLKVFSQTYSPLFDNSDSYNILATVEKMNGSKEKIAGFRKSLKEVFGKALGAKIKSELIQDKPGLFSKKTDPTVSKLFRAYQQCTLSGDLLDKDDIKTCEETFRTCGLSYKEKQDGAENNDQCHNVRKYKTANVTTAVIFRGLESKSTADQFCKDMKPNPSLTPRLSPTDSTK